MSSKPNKQQREADRRASAHCASQKLVEAYLRGESRSGSIDWVDLDLAYEHAREALTPIERRRIARRVLDEYAAVEV